MMFSDKRDFRSQCIHQTDYRAKYPDKQDSGCFVATIRHCVESEFETPMSMEQWSGMWARALREDAIKDNGYVSDHEHVGNIALDILGQWRKGYRFHYVRILDGVGDVTHTLAPEYGRKVNHYGIVWDSSNGIHMAYSPDGERVVWDPYPGLTLRSVNSVREYYIGRTA